MASGNELIASGDYIKHHLQNLTYGQNPDTGIWELAHTAQEAKDMGFMAVHLDTLGFVHIGLTFLIVFLSHWQEDDY